MGTLMGILLISMGWVMFVYGTWLYEHGHLIADQDNDRYQYIVNTKLENTFYRLSYAIMFEGAICVMLPFISH